MDRANDTISIKIEDHVPSVKDPDKDSFIHKGYSICEDGGCHGYTEDDVIEDITGEVVAQLDRHIKREHKSEYIDYENL